jgi:lipid A ethanolaminephosphotransferase
MLMWLSAGFEKSHGIQRSCLTKKRDSDLSHDNIFHSVLGMLGVNSGVLNKELDIFSSCRIDNF